MRIAVDTITMLQRNWTTDQAQIMCQMKRKRALQQRAPQHPKRLLGLQLHHNQQSSHQE